MKIALLGKGKTGGKVLDLILKAKLPYTLFDSGHTPTKDSLSGHDVIISFLPGEVFYTYLPLLVETKIPVICGSTGMSWPVDFDSKLKEKGIKWIYATNFSLGMSLVQQMIVVMSNAHKIFDKFSFSLNEIHHTNKLDTPSGTAISWKSWAKSDMNITSQRIADVVGIHELILSTPNEQISLKHQALDRKIFAEGAMFAADKILNDKSLAPGLHLFQDIVLRELIKGP